MRGKKSPFTLQIAIGGSRRFQQIAIGGSRRFQLISALLASQRFQSDFDSSWNSFSGPFQLVILMCHVKFSAKNEFVHLVQNISSLDSADRSRSRT